MGQKVNPKVIRLGITHDWNNKWYAGKGKYQDLFHQDIAIEKVLNKELEQDGIARYEIMRTQGRVIINVHTSKPGLIIGRGGELVEKLKEKLQKEFKENFAINIKEVKKPMLESRIVAESIARQVEKRVSYRRAAKMALDKVIESGAKGVKIYLGGRLNGVEISRSEFFTKGKIPLHTFRADIDYAAAKAHTTYGTIGIKVWIYRGEVFRRDLMAKVADQMNQD